MLAAVGWTRWLQEFPSNLGYSVKLLKILQGFKSFESQFLKHFWTVLKDKQIIENKPTNFVTVHMAGYLNEV